MTPTPVTTPEAGATRGAGASGPAERTVVESTVDGLVLRRDEGVLRIDRAELLRSKEGDEVFVRATVKGPADREGCFLMEQEAWSAFRDAIESGDPSDASAVYGTSWAAASSTQKFFSGDVLAVSFRENTSLGNAAAEPRDTPFFALCYKDTGLSGAAWYDVAHVEGTPKAS